MAGCVQECIFIKNLAGDICDPQFCKSPVVLEVDNQGAIALAKNPVKQERSKHIDVRYHFVRSEVTSGVVELYYVPSEYNRADVFTKPVSRGKFQQLLNLHMQNKNYRFRGSVKINLAFNTLNELI